MVKRLHEGVSLICKSDGLSANTPMFTFRILVGILMSFDFATCDKRNLYSLTLSIGLNIA